MKLINQKINKVAFVMFLVLLFVSSILWLECVIAIIIKIIAKETICLSIPLVKLLKYSIIAVLICNIMCLILMYDDDIRAIVVNYVKNHSTWWLVILTLGYVNVYLLHMCYTRHFYRLNDIYQSIFYKMLRAYFVMIPVVNTICYVDFLERLNDKRFSIRKFNTLILLLTGQLMTDVIRSGAEMRIHTDN